MTQTVMAGNVLDGLEEPIDAMRSIGAEFHRRNWSLGTSSNYSVVLSKDPLELLVTASGKHKEKLSRGDFVRVGVDGCPTSDGQPKSSAETLLHIVAARQPGVGAVLHTHSVWSTVLSDLFIRERHLEVDGYEMLKGLSGITTHETRMLIPIFENTQDIPELALEVEDRLANSAVPVHHGYLIRKHGLYTWGADLEEARRHVEIFEFLLECVARRYMLASATIDH